VVALLAYPFLGVGIFYLIEALAGGGRGLLLTAIALLLISSAVLPWAWLRRGNPRLPVPS
jgi:hypothetical protein